MEKYSFIIKPDREYTDCIVYRLSRVLMSENRGVITEDVPLLWLLGGRATLQKMRDVVSLGVAFSGSSLGLTLKRRSLNGTMRGVKVLSLAPPSVFLDNYRLYAMTRDLTPMRGSDLEKIAKRVFNHSCKDCCFVDVQHTVTGVKYFNYQQEDVWK